MEAQRSNPLHQNIRTPLLDTELSESGRNVVTEYIIAATLSLRLHDEATGVGPGHGCIALPLCVL